MWRKRKKQEVKTLREYSVELGYKKRVLDDLYGLINHHPQDIEEISLRTLPFCDCEEKLIDQYVCIIDDESRDFFRRDLLSNLVRYHNLDDFQLMDKISSRALEKKEKPYRINDFLTT